MKNTFKKTMQSLGYNYSKLTKDECFMPINENFDIEFYPETSPIHKVVLRLVLWRKNQTGEFFPIKKESVNGYDMQQLILAKDNLLNYYKTIL